MKNFTKNKLVPFLSLNSIITRRAAKIFEKIEVERSKKEKEIYKTIFRNKYIFIIGNL